MSMPMSPSAVPVRSFAAIRRPDSLRFSVRSLLSVSLILLTASGLFGCLGAPGAEGENLETAEFQLSIGPGLLTLNTGESVRINVVVSTTSAASLYTLTYASSNSQVASVSDDGVVKGIATGSAVVTVTATLLDTGKQVSASVTVEAIGAQTWTFCATEGSWCSFSGTRQVRYGTNGTYFYRTATGSIECTNAVFGDPVVGPVKSCDYSSTSTTVDAGTPPATSRDPLKQPFASESIWNMPIGSGAIYVPANLSGTPGNNTSAGMPQIDDEHIILKPTAPVTDVNYSSAGWSGANRCNATGGRLVSVPMPADYLAPNDINNGSAAFLLSDARTVIQTQPLARCTPGGPATSYVSFSPVDLYGDGRTGAHGGSGLSAIGGSIRVGELRPGSQGPRHALKVNVYAKEALFRCRSRADCFRWPAVTADGYAVGHYGTSNNNSNTAMKMGALLAIPASTDIASLGLETEPGRQLAWTLQNYGAYVVDDTWGPNFALNAETGPDGSLRTQFKADWGLAFEEWGPSKTSWSRDMQRLVRALQVVNNNTPSSIGGGGTPRQPLASPITP